MKISIITLFPKMISGFFEESIVKRAQEKNLVEIELINLRDFAINDYGQVDDRPYGGGAGMILQIEPLYNAIHQVKKSIKSIKSKVILTSAKGRVFKQKIAKEYSKLEHLVIIAGHYEGVDERVINYVDEEISIGDFVMTGGEIAGAVITDAIVRLIPGVLKKEEATQFESFNNNLLEYPHYTRPEEFMGKKVPKILLCGDPKKIDIWRREQALQKTKKSRKDLLVT